MTPRAKTVPRPARERGLPATLGVALSAVLTCATFAACGGTAAGIHAKLAWSERGLVVREVAADSVAEQAGLAAGDRILRIDGELVEGLTQAQVVARLRGEDGSYVTLEVQRSGEPATRSITIVRRPYRARGAPDAGTAPRS